MTQNLNDTLADAARTARQTLKDDRPGAASAARITGRLARQDDRLDALEERVKQLGWENRRGGGFPWGLLLLVGGGYALYRLSPAVQDRIRGLLGQADPGTKGNLNRAGAAVRDAAQAVVHGDDPGSAVEAAGGELKRAGEKTVGAAQGKLSDLQGDLRRKADDLTR